MEPVSLASGFFAAQAGQVQLAVAAKMMKMNADNQAGVARLLEAGQASLNRLANVSAGVGGQIDIKA